VRVSAGGAIASCGVRVDYRVAETPIFMQLSQLEEMAATGAGLTHTLMASGACLAAAIPEGYVAAGGNGPLQFCYFRFCAGPEPAGELVPRLVEIQPFPSVYGYQAVLCSGYRGAY